MWLIICVVFLALCVMGVATVLDGLFGGHRPLNDR